ncbi:hypothetical protein [Actinoplanes xinjiangensis]|uniref:Uncharacterized protein n=1 Tax=Actinoplanes xinjiangensis TaxID=512350 RepID=A0A316F595_9ACTN|nr:hypothetical protein [Actinoplanes xinjiangensis]PWK41212.1 hypothetical protein BC793_11779 [Actinoplanes xinjiangensis]GIF42144.1 hypothetical protein Axi01nite_64550 [Actinoplanes xinjiangensis]
MTKEPTKDPTDQSPETAAEHLPRHPAARPRAEADRELMPPDADLDDRPTGKGAAVTG